MSIYLTLTEFLQDSYRNHYVAMGHLRSYMRKSIRCIDGVTYKSLDRASTHSTRRNRSHNEALNPKVKSTGDYRKVDEFMREKARLYGFDIVYVENVLNEFLPAKLLEYGYTEIKCPVDGPSCFWILVKDS